MRTFNFSQSGWLDAGTLTGSFSGTVDSAGYLDLAGLTSFSISLPSYVTVGYGLADLDLFSYNPAGGASTLDIITQNHVGWGYPLCVGAAVQLSTTCNPVGLYPPSARGSYFYQVGYDYTAEAPVITEVTPAPTPLPAAWSAMLMGLAGFGLLEFVRNTRRRPLAA